MKKRIVLLSFFCGIIFLLNPVNCKREFQYTNKYSAILPQSTNQKMEMKNLFAWCIIPYDSKNRTPEERIEMLKELGFTSYAYDWREQHLNETVHELKLAKDSGINVIAVWIWIDTDKTGQLSSSNEKIFNALKETGTATQIWLGFNDNYFSGLNQEESVQKGIKILQYLNERATELNCEIALYNHGGWFGEPENQVEMIRRLRDCRIGIIYNFHHGHDQIERFPQILKIIKPYLWEVNLNGMKIEGPKIIPVGKGNLEKEMINLILNSGFEGPFGILGHTEGEDVKEVLQRNLDGLKSMEFLE